MILTEEEAKTKWCPEARVLAVVESPYLEAPANVVATASCNRGRDGEAAGLCIGSACMAWRWFEGLHLGQSIEGPRTHGYCGKAGRP